MADGQSVDTCWRLRGLRLRLDQTRVHPGCPGNRPSLLRSCRLLSIPGLTGTHCPALRRHAFRSLTPCHPFLQIRLNSRGLIYSVGLLLASVFVTVGLQLSPLSSSHVLPPPPWVLWLQFVWTPDGRGLLVDGDNQPPDAPSHGCFFQKWILATHEKAFSLSERSQPPLRSWVHLMSNTNFYQKPKGDPTFSARLVDRRLYPN